MNGQLQLNGGTIEGIRIQVQSKDGNWITLMQLPRHGLDDEGELVEAPYWTEAMNRTNALLSTPILG